MMQQLATEEKARSDGDSGLKKVYNNQQNSTIINIYILYHNIYYDIFTLVANVFKKNNKYEY